MSSKLITCLITNTIIASASLYNLQPYFKLSTLFYSVIQVWSFLLEQLSGDSRFFLARNSGLLASIIDPLCSSLMATIAVLITLRLPAD